MYIKRKTKIREKQKGNKTGIRRISEPRTRNKSSILRIWLNDCLIYNEKEVHVNVFGSINYAGENVWKFNIDIQG